MTGRSITQDQDSAFNAVFTQTNSFIHTADAKEINAALLQRTCTFHISMTICISFYDTHDLACFRYQFTNFFYIMSNQA